MSRAKWTVSIFAGCVVAMLAAGCEKDGGVKPEPSAKPATSAAAATATAAKSAGAPAPSAKAATPGVPAGGGW